MDARKTKAKKEKPKGKAEILNDYLQFKKISVHSKNKLEDIERTIKRFIFSSNKPLQDFKESELIAFLNSIDKKYSLRTLNDIKVYLKNFVKWYFVQFDNYAKEFRNLDRTCKTHKPPSTYSPEEILLKEEIEKLIQEDKTIFWKSYDMCFYYGGCRPIEVCSLEKNKIEFTSDGAFITIYSGKNNTEFEKFIPLDAAFYLKQQVERSPSNKWVFPTPRKERGDTPIKTKAVYFHFKNLSMKVLGKRINPYIWRHSVATLLYGREDLKDDAVATQLGHSKSMKATYTHYSKEKNQERARKMWIKPEELPPEKKHELEEKMEKMQKEIDFFRTFIEGKEWEDLDENGKRTGKYQKIGKYKEQ